MFTFSALAGVQTALISAINHSNFIKWSYVCMGFRAQEGVLVSPKVDEKWISALLGDPTAVALVINHSMFGKWWQVNFLRLKREFQDHNVALRPQNRSSQKQSKTSRSALMGDQAAIISTNSLTSFIKWSQLIFLGPKRGFPDHKVAHGPQRQPEFAKTTSTKKPKKLHFLQWFGTQWLLNLPLTTLFLLNNHECT